ncbi:MAG TPA: methyltransferase domain-containing protein [Thermoanaerobaculia bacterium]|nr:methyltransferase domain-containing protein [Thermoanaerobaculia bacterium]
MKRPRFHPDWPPEVQEIYRNDLREIWDRTIEPQVYNQYHAQLDLYRGIARRYGARTVLDVGCAQGTLALLLAEEGLRVTAVDIRQSFLDYARSRYEHGAIEFVAANIFERPSLGRFDLVFANQIIEHLVYPVELLRILAGYVDTGGVIVTSTPNHDYFRSSLPSYTDLGDPRSHEHRQFSAGGGDHFFAYTEAELRRAAAEAGLDVEEMIFFETPFISGHFGVRFVHGRAPVGMLRALDRAALRIAPRKLAHQICMIVRRRS